MSPRYDVLVVDLDGTLFGPDGGVSERNRVALARARDAGLEVMIATGRSPIEATDAIEAIRHEGLVIAASGSILYDARTEEVIDRQVLAADVVRTVTDVLLDHEHRVLLLKDRAAAGLDYVTIGEAPLNAASSWWFERHDVHVHDVNEPDEDPHPGDTLRVGAVAAEQALAPIAETLREALMDQALLHHWPAVTSTHAVGSPTHLLEVFGPDTDKWTAISAWCRARDQDPARVATIGDGLNDVRMVREAGLGVAMGNAMEVVRTEADRVVAGHDRDGVAEAVDHILAGRW